MQKFIKEHGLTDKWHFSINEKNLGYRKNFAQALKLTDAPEVLHLEEYYGTCLAYYKHPNLKTLAKLKYYPEYYADSKVRGRLWDYALALHLEKMIAKIAIR